LSPGLTLLAACWLWALSRIVVQRMTLPKLRLLEGYWPPPLLRCASCAGFLCCGGNLGDDVRGLHPAGVVGSAYGIAIFAAAVAWSVPSSAELFADLVEGKRLVPQGVVSGAALAASSRPCRRTPHRS
jgi:hypothetical protein